MIRPSRVRARGGGPRCHQETDALRTIWGNPWGIRVSRVGVLCCWTESLQLLTQVETEEHLQLPEVLLAEAGGGDGLWNLLGPAPVPSLSPLPEAPDLLRPPISHNGTVAAALVAAF